MMGDLLAPWPSADTGCAKGHFIVAVTVITVTGKQLTINYRVISVTYHDDHKVHSKFTPVDTQRHRGIWPSRGSET